MTALMAGLGLLPAALSHGICSETQRPFACVIVGGTLFTLLVLPMAIGLFGNFSDGAGDGTEDEDDDGHAHHIDAKRPAIPV